MELESLSSYTVAVSRAFMAGAASQAGDADSSRAPGLTSGLQGSVNVHRGALLLVPQWQWVSSFVFYIKIQATRTFNSTTPKNEPCKPAGRALFILGKIDCIRAFSSAKTWFLLFLLIDTDSSFVSFTCRISYSNFKTFDSRAHSILSS